jgi:Cu(I)/Ag(I) efflux system protein CusF
MNAIFPALAVLAFLATTPLVAHADTDHGSHHAAAPAVTTAAPPASAAAPMSKGEVRKIDKSAGKVTIKHGPLENLGMPPMTMVYRVKDPAMLDRLKEGDQIKFVVEQVDGAYIVTRVEATH